MVSNGGGGGNRSRVQICYSTVVINVRQIYLYRGTIQMATVELNCTHCGILFEKSSHEISRRKAKSKCTTTNWFCSRSCSASFCNKHRPNNGAHLIANPQFGNQHGRKWDPEISWYVKRMFSDGRSKTKPIHTKQEMHDHLQEIWTGYCQLSGVAITRRSDQCEERNPFFLASVDRKDNSKPYEVGNVQWTSLAMNLCRQHHELADFKQMLNQFNAAFPIFC